MIEREQLIKEGHTLDQARKAIAILDSIIHNLKSLYVKHEKARDA